MRRRALLASVAAATAGCAGFRGATDGHTDLPTTSNAPALPPKCEGPGELTGHSFDGEGGVDGPVRSATDRASVRWRVDPLRVTVAGTIGTVSMGPEATLDAVAYDREADRLRVDVTTEYPSPSETRTSLPAESAYDYRGRFAFEGSLPRTVVVRHDGTVVTDASCG